MSAKNQSAAPTITEQNQLVHIHKDMATANSLKIAEMFGKRHSHVIRDIESAFSDYPKEFTQPNFGLTYYTDKSNRKNKSCR